MSKIQKKIYLKILKNSFLEIVSFFMFVDIEQNIVFKFLLYSLQKNCLINFKTDSSVAIFSIVKIMQKIVF